MKIRISVSIFLLLIICLSCDNTTKTIEDLLTRNNEITGWTYLGSGWVANNISELYTEINGGAEVYQRHGFVEAAYQEYQGTINDSQAELCLSVYNLGNNTNAKGVYEDPAIALIGAIDWQGGAGEESHFARYPISQELTFYRGSYYVHLRIDGVSEEGLNILKQFALNVDAKIL